MAAGLGKLQSGGDKRKPDMLEEINALLVEQARGLSRQFEQLMDALQHRTVTVTGELLSEVQLVRRCPGALSLPHHYFSLLHSHLLPLTLRRPVEKRTGQSTTAKWPRGHT